MLYINLRKYNLKNKKSINENVKYLKIEIYFKTLPLLEYNKIVFLL